ncbi:hypothetical protein [Yinghuangia seranimata]|uniref:hypothetical protein n=1 Tax=Yinghuangia seranimata TaxID=408067 RepID=UPI00248C9EC3|nr:hypothetical protein [Yinghuangia seranimata]MDI2129757.1 hypothetical protein [Yinghuangia seranimata]
MHNQPKWAWWVVGILIPLLGIAVSIWAVNRGDSGSSDTSSSSTAPQNASGGSAATGGSQSGAPAATKPANPQNPAPEAKVLAGPVEVVLKDGASYLELDTVPPMALPGGKGADLVLLVNVPPPGFATEGSTKTLALLPEGSADPTAAECRQAVDKRGTYDGGDVKTGQRMCVVTDEGHVAYLKVLSAPTTVRAQVTVWE